MHIQHHRCILRLKHSVLLSLLTRSPGIDGVIHTRRARSAVHRAMVWSIAINGSLAIIMAGIVLIYMGNVDVALRSPNPFATIMLNITGSRAATTAIICGFFLLGFNSSLTTISSLSRLTWAWSRDGGLPAYFTYLDPKHRIPVRSVWLSAIFISLICLLNIGSQGVVAFSAITSLSAYVFFFSYSVVFGLPVFYTLVWRRISPWASGTWENGESQ